MFFEGRKTEKHKYHCGPGGLAGDPYLWKTVQNQDQNYVFLSGSSLTLQIPSFQIKIPRSYLTFQLKPSQQKPEGARIAQSALIYPPPSPVCVCFT